MFNKIKVYISYQSLKFYVIYFIKLEEIRCKFEDIIRNQDNRIKDKF
ncbi:hypothetical protein [Psychrobacillus phage Perkons]|nr:hypothetical protein [Psychrobacillus phage Perkons]